MLPDEFETHTNNLFKEYVEKCHKNYNKYKNYNSIAKIFLECWFQNFGPSLANLEILKSFSISIKENKEIYKKCTKNEKQIINLVIDSLDNVTMLTNSTMEIVCNLLHKL